MPTRRPNQTIDPASAGGYQPNYPATVAECIDPTMRFRRKVREAMKAFARAKPWQESVTQRIGKISVLMGGLCEAYSVPRCRLVFGLQLQDAYCPDNHTITLGRRAGHGPSVLSFLHEFGHHLGKDERDACRWSLNLFKRYFPRSYARLVPVGHTLRRAQ